MTRAAAALVLFGGACTCGAPPTGRGDGAGAEGAADAGVFCAGDDECPVGQVCRNGYCGPPPESFNHEPCTADEDCALGYRCALATGKCVLEAGDAGTPDLGTPSPPPECLFGDERNCGVSKVGECRWGIERCDGENGRWSGACAGAVYPKAEACNGLDDNCDGRVPDGERDRDGDTFRDCADCAPADPDRYPGASERCNGLDDDCDGEVPSLETDADHDGALNCNDCAPLTPSRHPGAAELCNGIDDDCDGRLPADEADADRDGVRICAGDCDDGDAARSPRRTESCDGKDNDCDGQTDEDLGATACGRGECARTVQNCVGGVPQACAPGPPATEICDGRDNDCDGATDELGSATCGRGECARTVQNCVSSVPQSCVPGDPAPAEACDGKDDDCDGATDEGFGRESCGLGDCARTVSSCVAGVPRACVPGTPAAEGCDGRDNDCDGVVPPDEADGDGDGVRGCAGDCDDTDPAMAPGRAEVCDHKDNNCNGTADEGLLVNLSSDVRVTDDPAESDFVAVDWSGDTFGIAWQDRRDGNAEIYFAQVSRAGAKVGGDVRVTSDPAFSSYPALRWNGSDFGLVWSDSRQDNRELWFTRLQRDGTRPAGVADRRVTNAPYNSDWPSLAWNGDGYGVVWEDLRNRMPDGSAQDDVYFARLDRDGVPLAETRVTSELLRQHKPRIAWSGASYGVVWIDQSDAAGDVWFARLSPAGAVLDKRAVAALPGSEQAWPDIVWNPQAQEWAVAWHDGRFSSRLEIFLARLAEDGTPVAPEVRVTNKPGNASFPSLEWTGSEYGICWQDNRTGNTEVYFTLLSAGGVKTGADLRASAANGSSSFTSIIWNGTQFAFAWKDMRDASASAPNNSEVYFAYAGCP